MNTSSLKLADDYKINKYIHALMLFQAVTARIYLAISLR
jgi:hypothetical protein